MSNDERVQIGTFGRAHGVRGEIRYFPLNPDSDLLEDGMRVYARRGDSDASLTITKVRHAAKFDIVAFDEIAGRDEAEALTNLDVYVEADTLPEPDEDEFYQRDLIGLDVAILESEDGPTRLIGEVDGFFETGANDVMVVSLSNGERLFVPMIENAVAVLDLDDGVLLQPADQWAPEGTEFP
jgi:16S rRNA processing protein RimM